MISIQPIVTCTNPERTSLLLERCETHPKISDIENGVHVLEKNVPDDPPADTLCNITSYQSTDAIRCPSYFPEIEQCG